MFEHKRQRLISKEAYRGRVIRNTLMASFFLAISLCLGILGYHYICSMPWIDSLLNASMILGGMGPVNEIPNDAGKIFASFYAIFSGVTFLGAFTLILAPIYHRFLHRFHIQTDD